MSTNMRHSRGYSLVELAIVVVVIAILSAIALPTYRKYVLKSHRTDATHTLQDLASREENYYFSNNGYTSTLSDLNSSSVAAGNYYTVSIASASSTDYTVSAAAIGTQTQDGPCQSFQLKRDGSRFSNGNANDASGCWGN